MMKSQSLYIPPRPDGFGVNVSCKASLEEIAALGPSRCIAFMNGVARVIAVLNPQTPVGGQTSANAARAANIPTEYK